MPLNPCVNASCENTVSDRMESGFCFTCLSRLQRESSELADDLDKVLRLAAEFDAYCAEHGLPDPRTKEIRAAPAL